MATAAQLDLEIDANYDWFRRNMADLMAQFSGRIVLLRHQALVDDFSSVAAAERAGNDRFPDGLYSLQPVIDEPVDLGFFSHAGG